MLYIKQNSSYVVHFIRKREAIRTEVLIYQSVHVSVHLHIGQSVSCDWYCHE